MNINRIYIALERLNGKFGYNKFSLKFGQDDRITILNDVGMVIITEGDLEKLHHQLIVMAIAVEQYEWETYNG